MAAYGELRISSARVAGSVRSRSRSWWIQASNFSWDVSSRGITAARLIGVVLGGLPIVTSTSTHEYWVLAAFFAVNSAVRGTPPGAALGTRYVALRVEEVPALTGHVIPSSEQESKSTCPRATPKTLTVMVSLSPETMSCLGAAVNVTVRFCPGIGESWAYAHAAKSKRAALASMFLVAAPM